jgi:hypothetical protein
MHRTSVSSSHLASIGYDASTHTLEVQFTDGAVYQYSNVPESVYRALMSASSHGEYFDDAIKKGGYSYRRIR